MSQQKSDQPKEVWKIRLVESSIQQFIMTTSWLELVPPLRPHVMYAKRAFVHWYAGEGGYAILLTMSDVRASCRLCIWCHGRLPFI